MTAQTGEEVGAESPARARIDWVKIVACVLLDLIKTNNNFTPK